MPRRASTGTPRSVLIRVRAVGNLLNLSTPAGLALAFAGRATVSRAPRGLYLAEGYRFGFPVAGAFTVGNVLLTSSRFADLEERYPDLRAHEEAHTWQYLCCGGLLYLVVYSAAMGWSVLRTGDRASANVFERRAGLVAGGYVEAPTRSVLDGMRGLLGRLSRS